MRSKVEDLSSIEFFLRPFRKKPLSSFLSSSILPDPKALISDPNIDYLLSNYFNFYLLSRYAILFIIPPVHDCYLNTLFLLSFFFFVSSKQSTPRPSLTMLFIWITRIMLPSSGNKYLGKGGKGTGELDVLDLDLCEHSVETGLLSSSFYFCKNLFELNLCLQNSKRKFGFQIYFLWR
jgi:hypothetical protein